LCRRREPGREQWQSWRQPPIDTLTGACAEFIEPPRTYVSSNTTPNVGIEPPYSVGSNDGLGPL
jgi:hypothetical protein